MIKVVDHVWPNKIKYNFSTPSKGVMYGSAIPCDFVLIPLRKGLRIGRVRTELLEERRIEIPKTADVYCPDKWTEEPETVCEDVYELPEGTETEDIEGHEGYHFTRNLALPRNLKICRQSFEHPSIRIDHHLRFVVALHNPEGHTSEACQHGLEVKTRANSV